MRGHGSSAYVKRQTLLVEKFKWGVSQGDWRKEGSGLNRIEEYKLYRKQDIPTCAIDA